jgi:hypothetical protein
MIYDPARHEALHADTWSEDRALSAIRQIVGDAEARFSPEHYWPAHPQDTDGGSSAPLMPLYFGALGVMWALRYLRDAGATALARDYSANLERVQHNNRLWLGDQYESSKSAYLMGDTPCLLMRHATDPANITVADELDNLIATNIDHPTRELMWGAPGTMLAASFLYERSGEERWAHWFRKTARQLWSQLQWSDEFACYYWTQDLYGTRATYLDAVHGFVATASPLIRGRALLEATEWSAWQDCIINTISRTATWQDSQVNWRACLVPPAGKGDRFLMQFCHGAPGFVVCLGGLPSSALDSLLLAAGETTWTAGPLTKGSNLCHGTGGNGYAFLKLYHRTRESRWLNRARAFAMHGIAQVEADRSKYGQGRYSLWTGDVGFAIYLWHCVHGTHEFPTLDVF